MRRGFDPDPRRLDVTSVVPMPRPVAGAPVAEIGVVDDRYVTVRLRGDPDSWRDALGVLRAWGWWESPERRWVIPAADHLPALYGLARYAVLRRETS